MKKIYLILLFCIIATFSKSQNVELDIKVFLEGPFSNYHMIPYLNVFGELPADQPFNSPPWNYNGNENVSNFPTFDIVDWILVEVIKLQGDGDVKTFELIKQKAGLLMQDGKVKDLDGSSNITLDLEGLSHIYIRIHHRNHLSVISAFPITESSGMFQYDFTTGPTQSMGDHYTQKQLSSTIWGMVAADADADGQIDNRDKNELWLLQNGSKGYYSGDFNMDSQVDEHDKDSKWGSNLGHASYATRDTIVPPFRCGDSLRDARDGQKYATIQIGFQCWMKNNLNIGTFIDGTNAHTNNGIIEKHCYNNEPDSCALYGGLYMWDEMMKYLTDTATKGICPPDPGWRLPTDFDWKTLEGNADSQFPLGDPLWNDLGYRGFDAGGHLKDTTTRFWFSPNTGATNITEFTALGGGIKYDGQNLFDLIGQSGFYWSTDQYSADNSYYREFYYSISQVNRQPITKSRSHSVRCINTTKGINHPPLQPWDPNPADTSYNINPDTTLSWSCSDPEGDMLTYNIYFGMDSNPPLVASAFADTIFNPGKLLLDSTYFWKIVAYDIMGDSTEGPIWSFTIRSWACGDILVDDRDDQSYTTALIGDQCWMAENLNIGTRIDSIENPADNETIEKYCYSNSDDSCDVYGGLYKWNEMMQYVTTERTKGICPSRWYIPTDEEWKQLEGKADSQFGYPDPVWDNQGWRGDDVGYNLKAQNGWFAGINGIDLFGFTALPAGLYDFNSLSFQSVSQMTAYWTSSSDVSNMAGLRMMDISNLNSLRIFNAPDFGFSVRCVMDTTPPNQLPLQPFDPKPENGSLNIDIDTTLSWSCSDPDGNDLTYNIYFGMNSNPPLVASAFPDTIFNPGELLINSTYHWKIVAYDIKGDSTEGPDWSFTTRSWACGDPLIDKRDAQSYITVMIGDRCWMAENLNIGTRIDSIENPAENGTIEKYCYSDSEDSCNVYGGLYKWNEMMQYVTTEGTEGICPSRWYLPTDEEWKQLEGAADSQFGYPDPVWDNQGWRGDDVGYNLKAQNGWFAGINGSDLFGFSALPAGLFDFNTSSFQSVTQMTAYWTSSSDVSNMAGLRMMDLSNLNSLRIFNAPDFGFSVRCVMDTIPPNQLPLQPFNPQPGDGALNIDVDTTLSWSCSDPDGDALTYNIYFGMDSNPTMIASAHADTIINPGELLTDSTYYWKIVAYDIKGDSTEGPIWSFTVRSFICGDHLIDDRDDQTYTTVQIDIQCWMAENLNIGSRIDSIENPADNGTIEKYCYSDSEDSCDVYGGLYKWNEMMQYVTAEGTVGICPSGWYLPTDEEWKQLEGEADSQFGYPDPVWDIQGWRGDDVGYNLKAQHGWFAGINGSDLVGFSALPAGFYDYNSFSFQSVTQMTGYWTSSSDVSNMAGLRMMDLSNLNSLRIFNIPDYGFSVRCVREE